MGYFHDAGGRQQTLIEHFDGTAWSVVTSPNPASDNALAGISAVSATDIWAVGTQADPGVTPERPLALHWDGSGWSVVAAPNPTSRAVLTAVTTIAANDAWTVGVSVDDAGYQRAFSEHWDGTSWTVVPADEHGSVDTQLYAVAATAANDAWAAGFYYDAPNHTTMPLIEHWDGSTWTAESTGGRSGGNYLWGVTALPSGEAWAVGTSTSNDPNRYFSLIESYESFRTCGTDLSITMTDSPDPIEADSNVTYTITVTNAGPDPARTAMVQDDLPSTVAFVSASPSQGTCSMANRQVTCDLGTINSGGQARVTIVATPVQPGSIGNYAQTWAPYDPDPDPTDNGAVVSTTVRPQANTAYVQVTGSGFNPPLVTIKQGTTVQWNFLQGTHTATDDTGMGLFGSGFRNSVDYFRFTFFAAGTYDVVDQVLPGNTSAVQVLTKATPKQGDPNTRFRIVWSTMFPPAGYAFDVEIRRPGSQGYVDYLVGTSLRNTNFVPDAGSGKYSFRADPEHGEGRGHAAVAIGHDQVLTGEGSGSELAETDHESAERRGSPGGGPLRLSSRTRVLGDVLVRVDVIARDAASAPVLGVERDPRTPSWSRSSWSLCSPEVGDDVALLLGQVLVVRLAAGQDRSHHASLPGRRRPRPGSRRGSRCGHRSRRRSPPAPRRCRACSSTG